RFYEDVLGLEAGERPPFPFPGLWLYAGDGTPVVHLVGTGAPAPGTGSGTGALDHVAFTARDLDATRRRLAEKGVPFSERTVPLLGMIQVFVNDPHGIRIELNFDESEAG
ncbi:MAG TPA: VOC family protein, partial [Kaistia sp.]|nr:VOC family protein [Kaistia sp.]